MVKVLFKPKELDLVCTIIIIIVTPFFLNWILVCYKVTWLGQGEGGGGEDREVQDSFLSYLKTSVGKELTRSKALAKVS